MRLSPRWIFIGALAMLGAVWLLRELAFHTLVDAAWLRFAIVVLAAAVSGALLAGFGAVRPWREPMVAALAAMGTAVASVAMQAEGRELLVEQLPKFLVHVVGSAAAATGGAAFVRWAAPRFRVGPGSIVLLGGLLTVGFVKTMFSVTSAIGIDSEWARIAVVVGGVFLGGFLTQGSIAARRPWLCGTGSVLLMLPLVERIRLGGEGEVIAGAALVIGVATVGAKVAWKRMLARGHHAEVDLPAAHASRDL